MVQMTHPVHVFGSIFTTEHGGTCWSCHLINERGEFLVITGKVDLTDKGLPKQLPVPNLWTPRQGTGGGT